MHKYIAILRGINVGGKRKILMNELKEMFSELGFREVHTYIQSGNVIFSSSKEVSEQELSQIIEKAILEQFGFDVPVIIRTVSQIEKAVINNPYYTKNEVDVERLCLTFLKETPLLEYKLDIEKFDFSPDKFVVLDKDVFIYCAGKYHQSKLTNNFFEKKLKVRATTRNWKTVMKLIELGR